MNILLTFIYWYLMFSVASMIGLAIFIYYDYKIHGVYIEDKDGNLRKVEKDTDRVC